MSSYDLRHLRYLLPLRRPAKWTRARQRGIQQPPVATIKALRPSSVCVAARHRGVSLPKADAASCDGRRLLGEAMRSVGMRVWPKAERVLAIAFTSSAAAHAFTPKALRACRSRFPEIELVISEHNAAEITDAVAAGRLHCGFLRVPVSRPAGVTLESLLSEPTMAAIPIDHPLARPRSRRSAAIVLKELHERI